MEPPEPRAALLPLTAALLLAGCAAQTFEGGGQTAEFHFPPPEPIPGVPDDVNEFLTLQDVRIMEQAGMVIHEGDDPPDIEGRYHLATPYIEWDDYSNAIGTPLMEAWVGFSNQQADASLDSTFEDDFTEAAGSGGFVSGEGDCFTAWVDVEGYNADDNCAFAMPELISGCVTSTGLTDFQFGYLMTWTDGDCYDTVDDGHRRIIGESDDFAERVETL